MPPQPLKVLIADDQEEIREIFAATLLAAGHVPLLAKNGHEAVEMAYRFRPDLIFLDIVMPVLDGLGALEKLRRSFPEARIVMMTACPEVDTVAKAFKKGAVAFLSKPFDMVAVKTILQEVAARKEAELPPTAAQPEPTVRRMKF